jgi:hypothetical protein
LRRLSEERSGDYCQAQEIQFTRGRPYKKDDNAHIEQKNWTHVRKLLGYVRYDSPAALAAINDLYRHELRLFQNFFLPSVKLVRKERVGARVRRRYESPRTPLERVLAGPETDGTVVAHLRRARSPRSLRAGPRDRPQARAHLRAVEPAPQSAAVCRREPGLASTPSRPQAVQHQTRRAGHRMAPLAAGNIGDGAMIQLPVTSSNGLTGREHVTLAVECIDRMYLNAYVRRRRPLAETYPIGRLDHPGLQDVHAVQARAHGDPLVLCRGLCVDGGEQGLLRCLPGRAAW